MSSALLLIGLVGIGVALGWWLKGRTALARKRALQIGLLLLGIPIPVWLFAVAIQSDTLAALAGFSMMGLLPCALLVIAGVFLGRWLRRE